MREVWPRVSKLQPNGVRSRPAATLVLIDRQEKAPRILMGRRSPKLKFMPNKFVFPGGQIDAEDKIMSCAGSLARPVEERLRQVRGRVMARALAMAAIRETFEETGLVIGASAEGEKIDDPGGGWTDFANQGLLPNLDAIHFIGRATTPPRMPRRFDTIFLAAEATSISAEINGAVGPDKELVELAWVSVKDTHDMDLPMITSVILRELEARLANGFGHELPVPWYRVRHPRGWERLEM